VLGLLLYVIVRFNEKRNPTPSRTTHNTTLEVLWTVIPVLILLFIAFGPPMSSFRLLYLADRAPDAAMTVKATGHQWFWTYDYPDNGNISITSTLNDKAKGCSVRDLISTHREIPVNLFWTRGHSIENYLSDTDIFTASLEEHVPEHLPANYKLHLQNAFPSILHNCASISLAANSIGKLDRIHNISELDHWVVQPDGSMGIDLARMQAILTIRGISAAEWVAFEAEHKRCLIQLAGSALSLSRWICHGHLAECHIWCAVAATLRHHGMDRNIAPRVGWGEREALVRVSRGAWSAQCASRVGDCPVALMQWLCR